MIEILVYVFESYGYPEACPEPEQLARKLTAAGFDNPTVEVTRSYTDPDLAELADDLTGPLPDGINLTEAITNLSGTFASAFIRADKAKM